MIPSLVVLAVAAALSACDQPASTAQPKTGTPTAVGPPGATAKPPAPAFKPGMAVSDRAGARLGEIKTVTETPDGLNVVIEIEGKLVGVAPSTLELRGGRAVSSQTRQEILAQAGAPR